MNYLNPITYSEAIFSYIVRETPTSPFHSDVITQAREFRITFLIYKLLLIKELPFDLSLTEEEDLLLYCNM